MLRAAITFFILGMIALLLGLTGVAGFSMEIARWLVIVFIALSLVGAVIHMLGGPGSRGKRVS